MAELFRCFFLAVIVGISLGANLPVEDGSVVCPDKSECPTGNTCCPEVGGRYGCCPFHNGVCCQDKVHCCPAHSQCDGTRFCNSSSIPSSQLFLRSLELLSLGKDEETARETDKLEMVAESDGGKAVEVSSLSTEGEVEGMEGSVWCPDRQHYCPDRNTCCLMKNHQWVCCPLPSASCCSDGYHCCPYGTHCDSTYHCIRHDPSSSAHLLLNFIASSEKMKKL